MHEIWTAVITTALTVAVSLLVTFIFNKVSGLPKQIREEKKAQKQAITNLENKDTELETKIDDNYTELNSKIDNEVLTRLAAVEEAVSHYPEYREQSRCIQQQLKDADVGILDVCKTIKEDIIANREMLDLRLKNLENREKNALREKIYHLWRTFTDSALNPAQAWTDMELHAFYELVKDYESLGGNDYVHKVILPAMTKLDVIPMDDLAAVKDLFESRNPIRRPKNQ